MIMRQYRVIWADDEIAAIVTEDSKKRWLDKYQLDIIATATTGEQLREAMRENIDLVDAVIVDANFDASEQLPAGERVISGLRRAFELNRLYNEEQRLNIPFFLFTGRPKSVLLEGREKDDSQSMIDLFEKTERWFEKSMGELSTERLFKKIKLDVDEVNTKDFALRSRFANEFNAARLLPKCGKWLMEALRFEYDVTGAYRDTENYFNPARRIWEKIFDACKTQKFIPRLPSMNSAVDYFYMKKAGAYTATKMIMSKTLVRSLEFFLNITQDGSHSNSDLSLGVIDYVNETKNVNLYRSILYIVMDLLLWYQRLLKNPPQGELWISDYEISGIVKRIGNKFYVANYQLDANGSKTVREGDEVGILSAIPNDRPFATPEGRYVDKYVYSSKYDILQ